MGEADMLALNTTQYGNQVSLLDLQQACSAMPFLAKARIVVVEGLLASIPDKAYMEELEGWLPDVPDFTRLVFLEPKPLPDNHRLLRLAGQNDAGYARRFDLPQGPQLEKWIRQQAESIGGEISPRAAQLLAANVGSDLAVLESELGKAGYV
ncbi:MAG: hypothetical protein R3C44_10210 [Chloroflexota bacterium]